MIFGSALLTMPRASHAEGLEDDFAATVVARDGDDAEAYAAARDAVDKANLAVNKDPESNVADLQARLAELEGFEAQLAEDPATRELVELSRLNLARAYLVMEDIEQAEAAMDQVLRVARERRPDVDQFGPTFAAYYDARREALDGLGRAEIAVECGVPCEVTIDAVPSEPESGPLYLGTYRVWIRAKDDSALEERHTVALDQPGEVVSVAFPTVGPEPEPEPEPEPVELAPAAPEWKRVLPRWASATLAIVGVGGLAAGAAMLSLDGTCPGGFDPVRQAQDCPELYESTNVGGALVGVGAAVAATGGVILIVDEVRVGKQSGRQATLTWTVRF